MLGLKGIEGVRTLRLQGKGRGMINTEGTDIKKDKGGKKKIERIWRKRITNYEC